VRFGSELAIARPKTGNCERVTVVPCTKRLLPGLVGKATMQIDRDSKGPGTLFAMVTAKMALRNRRHPVNNCASC